MCIVYQGNRRCHDVQWGGGKLVEADDLDIPWKTLAPVIHVDVTPKIVADQVNPFPYRHMPE